MKFGKRMQECLYYHWAEFYVNYNGLKKALKTGKRGAAFLVLLQAELDTVEQFFAQKERELAEVLRDFEQRTITSKDVGFVELCNALDHLREYVLVNYLAIRKIVKKHDKCCHASQPPTPRITVDAARLLARCTFFKSSHFASTLARMEGLLASIFFSAEPEPEGVCSLCCRWSRHIIVLSCHHRFCWGCFSTEVLPTGDHCVVCGCPTGLDPTSFKVGSVLHTVGERLGYQPLQTPPGTRSWLETEAEKPKYTSLQPAQSGGSPVLSYGTVPSVSGTPPVLPLKGHYWRLRQCRARIAHTATGLWSRVVRQIASLRQCSAMYLVLLVGIVAVALQQALSKSQTARAEYLLWTAVYLGACVGLHFFVSPLDHGMVSSAPTPSYTLFLKLVHFWLLCSFVVFHLPMWELLKADFSDAASLLLPLSLLNLPVLVVFDAFARRGVFSLSYGRNFLELVLNGLILSALCAFHGHYCLHVDLHLGPLTLCPSLLHDTALVPRLALFTVVSLTVCLTNYYFHSRRKVPGILWGGPLDPAAQRPSVQDDQPTDIQPMVSWYSIMQFSTVVNLLVSLKLFLGRFDMRVLHNKVRFTEEKQRVHTHFADRSELWFDFAADVGDGFHPTYEMARLMAQPSLDLTYTGTEGNAEGGDGFPARSVTLPRGNLLILGGDLAYPGPSYETYTKRLLRPFEDALPPSGTERQRSLPTNKPTMQELKSYRGPQAFCIPGNHDWYDGLEMFLRMICCSKWLGGWLLPQTTSYFALQLPHGWWLFGLDNGLAQDIDVPQFQYFSWVVEHHVGPQDRVIVVTHEPGWVLDNYFGGKTQRNVQDLVRYVVGDRCVLRLAGDIHHYTRHVPVKRPSLGEGVHPSQAPPGPVLVVSGGGGAFMHPTHSFQSGDIQYDDQAYRRVVAYPSPQVSRAFGIRNILKFRQVNWQFDVLGGSLYFLFVHSVLPLSPSALNDVLSCSSVTAGLAAFLHLLWSTVYLALTSSLPTFLAVVITVGVLLAFVDCTTLRYRMFLGLSHAFCHIAGAFFICLSIELGFEAATRHKIFNASATDGDLYFPYDALARQVPVLGSLVGLLPLGAQEAIRTLISSADVLQFTAILRNRILLSGFDSLTWGQYVAYYAATFLLYYVFAAPCMALLFGMYLFLCVTVFDTHWDSGYASLQIEHYKEFCRFHLNSRGDLEVFVVGVDHVPGHYHLDPHWGSRATEVSPDLSDGCSTPSGSRSSRDHLNGLPAVPPALWELGSNMSDTRLDTTTIPPSYTWRRPSRWLPSGKHTPPRIIDHFIIPKDSRAMRW